MSQKKGSHLLFAAAIAFWVLCGCAGLAAAQQLPLLLTAQRFSHGPVKVEIRPTARTYHVGQVVTMKVTLLDVRDKVVPSPRAITVEVSETDPAGRTSKGRVSFKSGDTMEHYGFTASRPGLYRITASQAHLRPGSYAVFVGGAAHQQARGTGWARGVWRAAVDRPSGFRPVALHRPLPESVGVPAGNAQVPASPQLMLLVPGQGHEFLADGIDPALIQVFYMSSSGDGAPTDITVWLNWSNGVLSPKPLVIHKGRNSAEASLRSKWPVNARIKIFSSSPAYPIVGTTEYTVKFGPPIYGIVAVVPEKLPLVDTGTVTAQLLGPGNVPVKTDKDIPVTIALNSPTVRLASASKHIEIRKNTSAVAIPLIPQELGNAKLEVSIPDRPTETYPITVTGLTVILLCLAGGVIGGVCAFDAFKGSLFWRIFLGIVGGAVLTWLYVFVGLPQVSWSIAHNLISALFVSVLGGFLGLRVLDFAVKQFGFTGKPSGS